MSSKTYSIVLWSSVIGAIALVVGGMIWLAQGGGQPQVYAPGINEITADDHVFGKADAKVTVVEYADYECPACGVLHPLVKQLQASYGDRVRFVYRNFPIPGHVNGKPAAYAAEAAALQGKFYEMADQIFAHQSDWSNLSPDALVKTMDSYAQALGLDMGKFRADEISDVVKAKVDQDAQSGTKAGVDSTPSFFINGVKFQPQSYDQFTRELDQALK